MLLKDRIISLVCPQTLLSWVTSKGPCTPRKELRIQEFFPRGKRRRRNTEHSTAALLCKKPFPPTALIRKKNRWSLPIRSAACYKGSGFPTRSPPVIRAGLDPLSLISHHGRDSYAARVFTTFTFTFTFYLYFIFAIRFIP